MKLKSKLISLFALFALVAAMPVFAQTEEKKQEDKEKKEEKSDKKDLTTRLRIEVTAGEENEPVDNASVYVRFQEERTLARDKKVEMNLKTNRSGVAISPEIPRGKVLVQVVAPGWKTFGQWYELEKDQQTIKIKLQKPPRWY